ncbi:hypothetical protein VNI00_003244 [Paramarasmius palmivorus]|uniref:Uncharacterized protein n=1 Tax=Paramarasmius palmivorus TaxID=297713 RepID=A0AAW0DPC1_9AGAR
MFLANEHDHHSLIVPEGDSLPKDRNSHKLDDKEKQDSKDNLAQDFTNFPPPIPDSGSRNEPYSRTTLQPYTSFLATRPLLSSSSHSVTSPTTLTITSSYSSSIPSTSFSSVTPSSSSDPSSSQRQTTNASSRRVPVPIIVAVSVGLAVFIGGAILLLRACSRPRRRDRPKPSLPILDDPFADGESYKSKDSPLFGGKERFSSQTAQIGALPPWTQYPQVAVIPPTQSPMSVVPDVYPSTVMHYNTTQGLLAPRPPPSQSVPTLGLGPSFMSGSSSHQATIGNSTNRLSTGTRSISVYPSSPPLAACDAAANTEGVGGPIPPPSDNSRRTPHAFSERTDDARSPSNTTHLSVSRGAYDGADVASPQFVAQGFDGDEVPLSPMPSGGRSRIKSSYTPGSYPRMSSVPSMLNSMNKRPNGDDTMTFDLRKLPPIHKPTEKSNMASSCLEMTSPSIPDSALHSPQPTLYPDDSLSVVYAKRLSSRRLYRKPTPKHYGRQQRTQDTEHELGTPGLKLHLQ